MTKDEQDNQILKLWHAEGNIWWKAEISISRSPLERRKFLLFSGTAFVFVSLWFERKNFFVLITNCSFFIVAKHETFESREWPWKRETLLGKNSRWCGRKFTFENILVTSKHDSDDKWMFYCSQFAWDFVEEVFDVKSFAGIISCDFKK